MMEYKRSNFLRKTAVVLGCLFWVSGTVFSSMIKPEKHAQLDVHIYVSSSVSKQIQAFNLFLMKKGLLKKYNVTPFIENYPVHLTLYLTGFKTEKIPAIESEVASIAGWWDKFSISTSKIVAGKSGYVLLIVKNNQKSHLQKLCNTVTAKLEKYRYKDYKMPEWMRFYPEKQISFQKYGTPNAFRQFNAHFSIFSAKLKNDDERNSFIKDMNDAITKFKFKSIDVKVKGIGIAYVDQFGQITKEINNYPLSNHK